MITFTLRLEGELPIGAPEDTDGHQQEREARERAAADRCHALVRSFGPELTVAEFEGDTIGTVDLLAEVRAAGG